jgi:hypothetical protein
VKIVQQPPIESGPFEGRLNGGQGFGLKHGR